MVLLECYSSLRRVSGELHEAKGCAWRAEGVWRHTVPTDQPLFRGVAPTKARARPDRVQAYHYSSAGCRAPFWSGYGGRAWGVGATGELVRVWQLHCTPLPAPSQPDLIKVSARNLSQKAAN